LQRRALVLHHEVPVPAARHTDVPDLPAHPDPVPLALEVPLHRAGDLGDRQDPALLESQRPLTHRLFTLSAVSCARRSSSSSRSPDFFFFSLSTSFRRGFCADGSPIFPSAATAAIRTLPSESSSRPTSAFSC